MKIQPFHAGDDAWLLVVGLTMLTDSTPGIQESSNRPPSIAYLSHWTNANTWANAGNAKEFPTIETALDYLRSHSDELCQTALCD